MLKKTLAFGLLAASAFVFTGPALADENVQQSQNAQVVDINAASVGPFANTEVDNEQSIYNTNSIFDESGDGFYDYFEDDQNTQASQNAQVADINAAAVGPFANTEVDNDQSIENDNEIVVDSPYGYIYDYGW